MVATWRHLPHPNSSLGAKPLSYLTPPPLPPPRPLFTAVEKWGRKNKEGGGKEGEYPLDKRSLGGMGNLPSGNYTCSSATAN